jgi:hypothetical protein
MSAKTYSSGEHWAEPLLVDSGNMSRHFILEAGAKLHATAFALGVYKENDDATACAPEVGGGKSSGEVADVIKPCARLGARAGGLSPGDGAMAKREPSASITITVDLKGEGAEFHLHALYIASGVGEYAGRAAIDVRVNHLAPGCTSRQLVKGIAAGEATAVFNGMVHVAAGAQKTDATQRNQNLQLTDTAHIHATPALEIYADDVKCSHGATVGRLDEEAIYYMRQRGVGEAEARRMQMHGFAAEIVNHCPAEAAGREAGREAGCELGREAIGARIAGIIDNI